MNSLSAKQKDRKLKKIDLLKKELRYEKQKFGGYFDGRGFRYTIAELFFEINDYKKTNRYLNWFYKTFPDDITYPHFKIGSSFAYYQSAKFDKCSSQLIKLNEDNTYILHILTNISIESQNKHEPNEYNKITWAKNELDNLKMNINIEFLNWIKHFIIQDKYQYWYKKYIAILKLIKDLDVSNERNELLDASYKCINDWINDCDKH